MLPLPEDFVDLSTAQDSANNSLRSIIGVVVDVLPPTITKTGDHMLTIKLLDPSLRDSVDNNGLRLRFFRSDPRILPQIKQPGDIMLVRNIKMTRFLGQPLGISHHKTTALVFPVASIPGPDDAMPDMPERRINCLGQPIDKEAFNLAEQTYVIQLKHEMESTIETLPPPPMLPANPSMEKAAPAESKKQRQSNSSFGPKFKLVKDLRHYDFADICGQVVKKFEGNRGVELYITDHTENKEVFFYAPPEMDADKDRDGDDYGYTTGAKKEWPGPYGFLVLKVNTRDPHSTYARDFVKEGDIVLLKNVKMKIMVDGAKLEGDMWPDSKNQAKVQIEKPKQIMDRPEVHALMERKERYWAARSGKAAAAAEQQEDKTKSTRAEKKKKRQKKRKAEAAAAASTEQNEAEPPSITKPLIKKDINPHVRCGHLEIPLSTIGTILDPDNTKHTNTLPNGKVQVLPFINVKYRTRVRVIDFGPKPLEDFAIPADARDGLDASQLGQSIDLNSSPAHEWAFSLLLEDAAKQPYSGTESDMMWVNLQHEEAQYLFGNNVGDPKDLRADAALLAKVRQQLFVLWGNLEEKNEDEAVSNLPFECCLMEYGIEMDDDDPDKAKAPMGYSRQYAMFGTTIL